MRRASPVRIQTVGIRCVLSEPSLVYHFYFNIYAQRKQAYFSKGGETMRIREFRTERGMSMKDLAERMGVSVATVSRWESGEDYPATIRLPLLADVLSCTLDALCGREPPDAGRAS